jgi:sporadic carbohydrate cluster 2OG-Fe(II) oxygenase
VQWLPLVNVHGTKSMYILPRRQSIEVSENLKKYEKSGMASLFDAVKNQLVPLNVPYGKVLIFSPTCLHGNTINEEPTSRWSFNCRFVALLGPTFSPEKSLGSYYLPITVKPATRIGINYRQPDGFHE